MISIDMAEEESQADRVVRAQAATILSDPDQVLWLAMKSSRVCTPEVHRPRLFGHMLNLSQSVPQMRLHLEAIVAGLPASQWKVDFPDGFSDPTRKKGRESI